MVAFKSTLSALAVLALSGGVLADHWITVVNGCNTRTTKPTLLLESGQYSGPTSATLAPGASTVFKLTSNYGYSGIIYDAQNGTATSASNLGFNFAPSGDGQIAQAAFVLSNYYGFTIPQVAVAWPSTQTCATRRCYSGAGCPDTQAVPLGQSSASAISRATSTCATADTGLTLYYCSAQ